MPLAQNLYHILGFEETGNGDSGNLETSDSWVFTVALHPASNIYKAHFPGMPITPGACLLQMAQEMLSHRLGSPLRIAAAKSIKFVGTINPLQTHELTFRFSNIQNLRNSLEREESDDTLNNTIKDTIEVVLTVNDADRVCAKMNIGLCPE